MATVMEAKPFIAGLNLTQQNDMPFPVFQNKECVLTVCGIGKVNAAMATTFGCLKFHPDMVVNLGSAGATDPAVSLGDIFQISAVYEFDYPEIKSGEPVLLTPDTLNGFKNACIATQDRPVLSPDQRKQVFCLAGLADMEAAAVLRSCNRFGKKCLIYKFVSDTPKHVDGADIIAHIRKYRNTFFSFFHQNVLPRLK
jgi:adenosylhomocysteine nucleosidase